MILKEPFKDLIYVGTGTPTYEEYVICIKHRVSVKN